MVYGAHITLLSHNVFDLLSHSVTKEITGKDNWSISARLLSGKSVLSVERLNTANTI